MGEQRQLGLRTPSELGVPAETVQALRNALADGGWKTAKQLRTCGFDDRELRVISQHHDEEFVTGNKGYKLMALATVDEIRQSADRLEAQAKKMLARVLHLRNAAHRRLHAGPPLLSEHATTSAS